MKSTVLSRNAARHDVARAGAEVRLIDGQLFSVKRYAPVDNLPAWFENDLKMRNAWGPAYSLRTVGTNPTTWDTGDPDTLARLIEMHHDYPSADMLGHLIAD